MPPKTILVSEGESDALLFQSWANSADRTPCIRIRIFSDSAKLFCLSISDKQTRQATGIEPDIQGKFLVLKIDGETLACPLDNSVGPCPESGKSINRSQSNKQLLKY